MKHLILTAGVTLALTACATGPSAYGPATSSNSLGFQNTQIEKDRFRIAYTGRTEAEARDFALLRAAEIALNEGYSHFKVLGGNTSGNGGASPVSSRIGIGVGSGGYGWGRRGGSRTNVNVGIGIHDVARALEGSKVTESIEVILKRSGSDDPSVYNAKSVSESIRPAVFTE